jgi:beta-phosphoglucomutase-like phosphatase (HAD superfamily)
MAIKNIIFDCDGVLVDTVTPHYQIMSEYLTEHGITMTAAEIVARHSGAMWKSFFPILEKEFGVKLPESCYGDLRDAMLTYDRAVGLDACTDVEKLLRDPSFKKACASNSKTPTVKEHITNHGWNDVFETIVGVDLIDNPKPAPDIYLMALEKAGFKPSETIVVEDSPTGVRAGKMAGMQVMAYTGVYPNKAERTALMKEAGADWVMDDYNEILEFLTGAADKAA